MTELLLVYLVVGVLAAMAQGQWRMSAFARAMLVWPALLPRMIRQDPSPHDPLPDLAAWRPRIESALHSLRVALEVVDTVDELRPERRVEFRHDFATCAFLDFARRS